MASVCSWYMTCLDEGKTERESARLTVSMAENRDTEISGRWCRRESL